MKLRPLLIACAVCAMPAANAQSIDERIAAAQSPDVMLEFATRAGVCGNGRNIRFDDSSRNRWFEPCEYGPAHVRLRLDDGQVRSIRTFVGGSRTAGANVTDLGEVPGIEAAQWFLELARTAPATIAEDAIMPAAIADAPDPWRDLLAIARNGRIDSEVRENAVFWVGQSAAREQRHAKHRGPKSSRIRAVAAR